MMFTGSGKQADTTKLWLKVVTVVTKMTVTWSERFVSDTEGDDDNDKDNCLQ